MAKKTAAKLFDNEAVEGEAKELPSKDVGDDGIIDVDLSVIERKRFRINGDNSKILLLNTSDLRVGARMQEAYEKLNNLMDDVVNRLGEVPDEAGEASEEQTADVFKALDEIDKEMREQVDYVFDSNVSEICASDGSMWDPLDGAFRYEHIMEAISGLYENNLSQEFAKMKGRVEDRSAKIKKMRGSKYHR